MTITFHCKYCNKRIEAKDTAGGKWGSCPACHNKIYVPANIPDDEELKLAPLDEEDIQRQQQLMAETFQFSQQILNEREVDESPAKPEVQQVTDEQLTEKIISYLLCSFDSELDQAQQIAVQIKPHRQKALPILDRIALSDIPEQGLEGIPHQVLAGLIRTLRSQVS